EGQLVAQSIPASRIYTIADIYKDPHFAARNMLVDVAHPQLGSTRQAGVVPKLSRTPGAIRHTGPDIGSDTEQILLDLGLDASHIEDLKRRRVVKSADATAALKVGNERDSEGYA